VTETARIEAFSDGVFAIAVTLLVLDLKVPRDLENDVTLGAALLQEWPAYLAFVASFVTILIMWINHHRMFTLIGRADDTLMFANGMLLFGVTALPFPTSLVADYLGHPGQFLAAAVYNGTFILISVGFNFVWFTARSRLKSTADPAAVQAITDSYRLGPVMYLVTFAIGFANVAVSLLLVLGMALYWALPKRAKRTRA